MQKYIRNSTSILFKMKRFYEKLHTSLRNVSMVFWIFASILNKFKVKFQIKRHKCENALNL